MDLAPDPVIEDLRKTLRASLAQVPLQPKMHGAPVIDGPAGPAHDVLHALEAFKFERPGDEGGYDLGLTAGVVVSEELGRAACGNPYRAAAVAAETGGHAGAALAGFDALPVGTGISATRKPGGFTLTGTVTIDAPALGPGPLLVATQTGTGPALASVAPDAQGLHLDTTNWPPLLQLDAVPVRTSDLVGDLEDEASDLLARARIRQAAYLLGIGDGALSLTTRYTGNRRQFDTRLLELQAVAFPLARAVVESRAVRALVYQGAWLADNGDRTARIMAAKALAMAAETARDTANLCMHLCGVRAITHELGLHRYFRLAAGEARRYGTSSMLWRLVGAARLAGATRDRHR